MTRSGATLPTLLLLCLLAAGGNASHTARRQLRPGPAKISGKAIVLSQTLRGQKTERLLAVRTPAGRRVQVHLRDASQLAGIQTGMRIEVTGQWRATTPTPAGADGEMQVAAAGAAPAPSSFQAATIRASGAAFAAPKVATVPAAPAGPSSDGMVAAAAAAPQPAITLTTNQLVTSAVNTIVVPIAGMADSSTACPGTAAPKFSVDAVRKTVFAEANPSGTTVGSTFGRCSYGKTQLTAANSRVADLVQLPCNGTNNGVAWTFSKCDFDDFNGYADAADEALAARGINLSKYKYRVYLIPPGTCPFVGLGYIGCDGSYDCRAWIGADFWATPQAITHELGHNLFMAHAGAYTATGTWDEYADSTCTMGYCCTDRCPNTPHAWQLGWISAQQLDGSSLKAGQTVKATLFSQAASSRSGLRILPSWTTGVDPIFLGYRTRARGDAALPPELAGKVHVYSAAITNTFDAQYTVWNGTLGVAGATWQHAAAGLVVRVQAVASGSATVTVCRKGGSETAATCAAGTDNDCNGLAGPADPACAKLLAAARTAATGKRVRRPSRHL